MAAHSDLSGSGNQEAEETRWKGTRTGQFSEADNYWEGITEVISQ